MIVYYAVILVCSVVLRVSLLFLYFEINKRLPSFRTVSVIEVLCILNIYLFHLYNLGVGIL